MGKKAKSNLQKQFDAHAKASLRPMQKSCGHVECMANGGKVCMHMADGGLVRNRMQAMEVAAGAQQPVALTPNPGLPPAPAPVPATQPVAAPAQPTDPISPEEIALRQKYGMAVPGQPKPGMLDTLRKKIGFADGGEVKTPQQIAAEAGFPITAPSKTVINGKMPPPKPVTAPVAPNPIMGVRAADGGRISLRHAVRAGQMGGAVSGPGGPTDDKIPAMLSDGEYVLPADVVDVVGKENLDKLVHENHTPAKAQGLRYYANGGGVGAPPVYSNPNPIYVNTDGTAVDDTTFRKANAGRSMLQAGLVEGQPASTPGAQPEITRATGPAPRPTLRSAIPNVMRGVDAVKGSAGGAMRVLGTVAEPALETYRTGQVAADPRSTPADIATQAASGTARAAGTLAGAGIGTVVGGPIGTLIGGAAGYVLPDQAIKIGRRLMGTDAADPYERQNPSPAPKPTLRVPTGRGWDEGGQARMEELMRTAGPAIEQSATGEAPQANQADDAIRVMREAQRQESLRRRYAPAQYTAEESSTPSLRGTDETMARLKYETEYSPSDRLFLDKHARQLGVENAKLANAAAIAKANNQVSLRGQDITARGQDMTAQTAANAAKLDQMQKDRQYALDKDKFGVDVAEKNRAATTAAQESMQKDLQNRFRTTDAKGNDVPDHAKIADYTQAATVTLPSMIDALKRTGNPEAVRKAAMLEKRGLAGLTPQDHADLQQLYDRRERMAQARGIGPNAADYQHSDNLLDYRQLPADKGVDKRTLGGDRVVTPAGSISINDLRYKEGPANAILPDIFKLEDRNMTRGLRINKN